MTEGRQLPYLHRREFQRLKKGSLDPIGDVTPAPRHGADGKSSGREQQFARFPAGFFTDFLGKIQTITGCLATSCNTQKPKIQLHVHQGQGGSSNVKGRSLNSFLKLHRKLNYRTTCNSS